jgi:hypothetical protein
LDGRVARFASALVLVLVLGPAARAAGPPPVIVALDTGGGLLVFAADRPGTVRKVTPKGTSGRLVGIDERPADGHLYGLAGTSDLYRIDPASGAATLVATLTVPFDGEERSGVDFNPQADRLRLVSADGQNLRVHPGMGATAVDRPIAWAPGDPNAGHRPHVTAAAYTNNVRDAPTTKLFVIDGELDVLALQDPPNDGRLSTVGRLGVDFGPLGGFDIVTDADGTDRAYAASGATLYAVDLATGAATPLGTIGDGTASVVALAVSRETQAP